MHSKVSHVLFPISSLTDNYIVYQYTYRVPGSGKDGKEAKAWAVLWDYNVGLVRMTPFFRSLAQNKVNKSDSITSKLANHDRPNRPKRSE